MMSMNIVRQLLEEWRIYCDAHSRMHTSALSYYKFANRTIMILSILMSSISSALSLTMVSNNSNTCATSTFTSTLIILNSIGVASSALLTIHRFLNLDELQHLHDLYSDSHLTLAKDIQMNMVLQQGEKPIFHSIEEMTKNVKSRLDTLIDKAPAIPGFVVNRVVIKSNELYFHSIQNMQGIESLHAIV
jgi:hypothetical protein